MRSSIFGYSRDEVLEVRKNTGRHPLHAIGPRVETIGDLRHDPIAKRLAVTGGSGEVILLNDHQASGVASTGRQLGGVLGVAVLGASFVANGSFATVFWLATAVTVVVWLAAFALIDRPRRSDRSDLIADADTSLAS